MLRDPTSRGLYVRVFGLWRVCFPPYLVRPGRRLPEPESGHLTLVSGAGEGEVVSKKVGKEVRGAQG